MLQAGQVFLGKYPPGSGKDRRFLVVTDEDDGEETVVWVVTSTQLSDSTVILEPGDHPVITRRCAVIYSEAQVVQTRIIRIAWEAGALKGAGKLTQQILAKVQEGVFESDETPMRVVNYCKVSSSTYKRASFARPTRTGSVAIWRLPPPVVPVLPRNI